MRGLERASVRRRSVDRLVAIQDQPGAWQVAIHFEYLSGCYFLNNIGYREYEVSTLDYGFGLDCDGIESSSMTSFSLRSRITMYQWWFWLMGQRIMSCLSQDCSKRRNRLSMMWETEWLCTANALQSVGVVVEEIYRWPSVSKSRSMCDFYICTGPTSNERVKVGNRPWTVLIDHSLGSLAVFEVATRQSRSMRLTHWESLVRRVKIENRGIS